MPRPTALHDRTGWRAPKVRLLDRTLDDASTVWRPTVVVRLPTDGKAGNEALPTRRGFHLRVARGLPVRLSLTTRNSSRPSIAARLQVKGEARRRWWRGLHPQAEVDALANL